MWTGLGTLLLTSISLAVSSLLAGSLPLVFTLSRRHMRLFTACGTGILVGTALIVIIPEGVETLYSAKPAGATSAHHLQERGVWTAGAGSWAHTVNPIIALPAQFEPRVHSALAGRAAAAAGATLTGPDDGKLPAAKEMITTSNNMIEQTAHSPADHDFEPHAWVGISIMAGFVLMYLIDKLPKLASSNANLRPAYISLGRMGLRRSSSPEDHDQGTELTREVSWGEAFKPSSTTTGLVIHAAADGIALGASSASSSQKLSTIIFLALMIHKAPAAFGLTAVLLKQGLSKRAARTHLIVFSLAAPVGALATWLAAHILGGSVLDSGPKTTFITALLLLFSGGTFLYVAMHTMQEGGHDHIAEDNTRENGYADIYQQQTVKEAESPTLIDTLVTVAGMLLPLLTQVGHAH
ncbi:Zinc/iron permease [Myriangium duriaei CBS 260.36]|uniref:Zinc/iron permease n=1 Tax=Myriangium duriaei CBS 260.36 TaxID=1168546 RepID=A0A9P4J1G5_9PEZI|nr:Zinc/iron permease [Myriangium duriaei CBS 260.36]